MADAADENYHVETHKSKHKRGDRTERRQRGVNRHGDGIDGTPSPAKERNNPGLDDSGVTNDCASSVDRESGRRERRDRRKPKEDGETNANDEASVEGATAAPEESSPKKSLKKIEKRKQRAQEATKEASQRETSVDRSCYNARRCRCGCE